MTTDDAHGIIPTVYVGRQRIGGTTGPAYADRRIARRKARKGGTRFRVIRGRRRTYVLDVMAYCYLLPATSSLHVFYNEPR